MIDGQGGDNDSVEWAVGLGVFVAVIAILAVTSWFESRLGSKHQGLDILEDETGEVEIGDESAPQ